MSSPYTVFRAKNVPFECVLRVGQEGGFFVYLWPESWTGSRLARPDFYYQYAEANKSTSDLTIHEMLQSYPNTDELTREKFADVYSYLSRKHGVKKMNEAQTAADTSKATNLPPPAKQPVKKNAAGGTPKATKKKASGAKAPAKKTAAAPAKKAAAPAKKTAAKKAAKPKAEGTGKRGAPTKFDLTAKITMVEKTNPKREGTKAYDEYELYKTCKTVGAYIEAGGTPGYMNHDESRGFLSSLLNHID